MPIKETGSSNRFEFSGNVTKKEIIELTKNPKIEVLQTSEPCNDKTYKLLNDYFFSIRKDVQLRLYGFYSSECDLGILGKLPNIESFSADCLQSVKNIESLENLGNLKKLCIGIYKLDNFDFLSIIPESIIDLSLRDTYSKKPDLKDLKRFKKLKTIYLEGQQKNIEVLSDLVNLEDVTLRSISTQDLSYIENLSKLYSLDIKLGGIKNFDSLKKIPTIKYLELWQIRKLYDIDFLSEMFELQYLFLQNLPLIKQFPDLSLCRNLRRIYVESLKALNDFSSLENVPNLEEFALCDAAKQSPTDVIPVLRNKNLKRASGYFGSKKKNAEFKELIVKYGIDEYSHRKFIFQ